MSNKPCLDPLHSIEQASVDELRALQLERMKYSLRHAYDNSPVYRAKFDTHGVHPDDLVGLARSRSLHDRARSTEPVGLGPRGGSHDRPGRGGV